jgi:hypothetical protein
LSVFFRVYFGRTPLAVMFDGGPFQRAVNMEIRQNQATPGRSVWQGKQVAGKMAGATMWTECSHRRARVVITAKAMLCCTRSMDGRMLW